MIRHIILLIGIALPGTIKITAQQAPVNQRIKAERVAFYNDKLELTAKEAEKFWPVYNDYTNRQEKLNMERRMLLRYIDSNSDNMSEEEIEESLRKYIENQNASHALFIEYNKKFLEILPVEKVIRLYIVENQFKQYLLRKIGDARMERAGGRR